MKDEFREGGQRLDIEELEARRSGDALTQQALRLLARWLVAASKKRTPVADSTSADGSQNRLDVGPEAKVGSDGR